MICYYHYSCNGNYVSLCSKCKSAYGSYFRAGNKYYIEAVHKESSGDDYITVRASEPNGQKRLITDSEMQWALTGM